jgi:hypothetical protein
VILRVDDADATAAAADDDIHLEVLVVAAAYVALSFNPDLGMDMCVCFFIVSAVISHTSRNPSMVHLPFCRCSGGIVCDSSQD